MLVLLPPSETKAAGGDGPPLDLAALSFPALTPVRERLTAALVALTADVPASLAALGLSRRQLDEVARNAALWRSPTLPALARYAGVLYEALDIDDLSATERARAQARLAVSSALFGVVRGTDPVPAYRLSAGSLLPGVGPLRAVWRSAAEPVLSDVDDLVVDLRSAGYAALARIPSAVAVRVVSEDATGRRTAVSHHNKAHKGRLARALASVAAEPASAEDVARVAKGAGFRVELVGNGSLELIVSSH